MTRSAPTDISHHADTEQYTGKLTRVPARRLRHVGDNQVLGFGGTAGGWLVQLLCVDTEDGSRRELVAPVVGFALVRRRAVEGIVTELEPVFIEYGAPINISDYRRLHDLERVSCRVVREQAA